MTDALSLAASVLERHGVIGLPTDTVYGIGARAEDLEACDRIFAMKDRPDGLALPVLIGDEAQARRLAHLWDERLSALAASFWPGALTVVVARKGGLHLGVGGNDETVGLRCPNNAVVRDLCRLVGPLAVTSANRHGEAPATTSSECAAIFGDELSFVLDGGICDGVPSSVIAYEPSGITMLREGAISLEECPAVWGER